MNSGGTVIAFPSKRPADVRSRNREVALQALLPKLLGILWEHGRTASEGRATASVGTDLEVGGFPCRGSHFTGIDLYARGPAGIVKVLSIHVASEPSGFRYCGGKVDVLSLRRGPWENQILAEKVEPRTPAHLAYSSLVRPSHTH